MRELDLSQPITLDTGHYDVVQRAGDWVRLRPQHPGDTIDLRRSELARRIVGLPPMLDAAPRALETVCDNARRNATTWEQHLVQIDTGCGPDGTIRAEYDPATTTQEQRIATKISELEMHHGREVSRATVMRHLRNYRQSGVAGLVDGRATRSRGPLDQLDARVHEALTEVIASQTTASSGTKSRIIRDTHALLLRRFGADAPEMPSKASMYRYIDVLGAHRHTTGRATTRRSLANRPKRTFADASQLLPGAEVQIDSTKLDVMIAGQNGPERPTLTIMLDVATRSILAWTLRLKATKGVDHAVLLAQALTPPENRPSRGAQRAAVAARYPTLHLLSNEEHQRAQQAAPNVYPRAVTIDNGKDYLSTAFRSALQRFGIDVNLSAPHTPTDKPHVERTFRSINTLFTQHLPGYTGRSPVDRGYKIEDKQLLDLWALFELLDDFFLNTWQNRPHAGLTDRYNPTVTYSPNQMLAAAAQITSTLYLPLTAQDYIQLLPVEHRAVTATGVQIGNRHYDSDELHPLRDTKSSNPAQRGKWTVHFDPYNWQTVWVVGRDGELIECSPRNQHLADQPYAAEFGVGAEYDETTRTHTARETANRHGVPIHQPPRPAPELAQILPEFDLGAITGYTAFDPDEE